MDSGGGVNKYLHKKFKKQTNIEPTIVVASHVPIQPIEERQHQHQQPFRHSTNTSLQSSISSELSERPETAYTFVNFSRHHDRQEPPGGTALVVRKLDSTCSEQSDEDISNHAKIKRSPKEPTHLFRPSSINQDSKVNRLIDDVICKEEISTSRTFEANNASTSTAGNSGKYVCPFCNLACSKPSVLQKHIRAHTNERPYPCQSCNFSFKTRSNLYKHCRSRTHVNRVNGNKGQDIETHSITPPPMQVDRPSVIADMPIVNNMDESPMKTKPYKPRFHTKSYYDNENEENSLPLNNEKNLDATDHISEHTVKIISGVKADGFEQRIPPVEGHAYVQSCYANNSISLDAVKNSSDDQPLNLTNKNRKRCLSEVSTEPAKKSLIKELLLKNLNADSNLQCAHCKMIFKTFTELELHKMKPCKGRSSPRYSRSSSVNVASILTQNKNAFDNIPQIASMFPLKSPGPFLGNTRLVESDKSKSYSCDDDIRGSIANHFISSFDLFYDRVRKPPVKLFGGEMKVTQPINQNDSDDTYPQSEQADKSDYQVSHKLNENRVIRNTLQSGGIVVHTQHEKHNSVIKANEKVENRSVNGGNGVYSNIMDFSQNAAKLLAPNLKQLNLTIPGIPTPTKFIETTQPSLLALSQNKSPPKTLSNGESTNPMNLFVNGKVIRYVPGMPGPVIAESIKQKPTIQITPSTDDVDKVTSSSVKLETTSPSTTSSSVKVESFEPPSVPTDTAPRKFARPNSLALKPSSASLKHHHGLTPTMFNQILISPDTPRGDKKYNEQFLHGNYFSYLGLKCSTRSVYCTLNKTQPFYVPHFKKLSMYSEWRQQDHKSDKLYASNYNSWQRNGSFSIAGKYNADMVVNSSYKFIPDDVTNNKEGTTNVNNKAILDGYESHEDYTYVRGRDESSTRNQEHEAAYGLLSLSQKINPAKELQSPSPSSETINCSFINDEQLVHVSKSNYAKNKILDQISLSPLKLVGSTTDSISKQSNTFVQHVRETRPLTYPYSTQNTASEEAPQSISSEPASSDQSPERNIIHFNVIKRYNPQTKPTPVATKSKDHVYQQAPKQISTSVEHITVQPTPLDERKRKLSEGLQAGYKVVINDSEAMDLSVPEKVNNTIEYNDKVAYKNAHNNNNRIPSNEDRGLIDHYVIQTSKNVVQNGLKMREYDNSAMETLADIATKQEKLEKNSVAKNVATEFLKLATKNENLKTEEKSFGVPTSVAKSDMIVKSEENKNCTICNKTFNKPSQLRLHMNIHYLERPYRCESCSVSFRTKGHLQKHERSAGHHNKLSSSPALSSLEPRPFKCIDCSIAFRIHGHLAKHLRSKMHILKLECLSKIPFGLYAELERSNSLLTEINTADGDQCLDSLKTLARRIFINDPGKLNQLNEEKTIEYLGSDTTVS